MKKGIAAVLLVFIFLINTSFYYGSGPSSERRVLKHFGSSLRDRSAHNDG